MGVLQNLKKNVLAVALCWLCSSLHTAADETVFEALNADGDRFNGSIVLLDDEKVVLQTADGLKDIPLERLSSLQNQGTNPLLERKTEQTNLSSQRILGNERRVVRPKNFLVLPAVPIQNFPQPLPRPVAESVPQAAFPTAFPQGAAFLELRDGSRIAVASFSMKNTTVSCRFLNGGDFSFPLEQLKAVRLTVQGLNDVLSPPEDWKKYTAANEKSDRLITGQSGSLDAYTGILQEVTENTVSFSVDGETLPVPRRKVFGILLALPQGTDSSAEKVPSFGLMKQWDGSVLVLRSLNCNENGSVKWTTVSGISGVHKPAEIESFDFGRKNASYLSELPFVSKEQAVFFGTSSVPRSPMELFQQFRANQWNTGTDSAQAPALMLTPLAEESQGQIPERPLPRLNGFLLNNTMYEYGLSLSAQSVREYTLSEPFQTLRFVAGIDDRLRPNGRVLVRIQADGQLLFEAVLEGSQPAIRKELNISGVSKITLSAEYPGGFSEPAILTLGDAKLIK